MTHDADQDCLHLLRLDEIAPVQIGPGLGGVLERKPGARAQARLELRILATAGFPALLVVCLVPALLERCARYSRGKQSGGRRVRAGSDGALYDQKLAHG